MRARIEYPRSDKAKSVHRKRANNLSKYMGKVFEDQAEKGEWALSFDESSL